MALISKQETSLKLISEQFNSEIENIKRKLEKLEKETFVKGAEVNLEEKDKGNNHSRKEENRDDQISDEIPKPDKTKFSNKLAKIKFIETTVKSR